jgi:hypothetical protein
VDTSKVATDVVVIAVPVMFKVPDVTVPKAHAAFTLPLKVMSAALAPMVHRDRMAAAVACFIDLLQVRDWDSPVIEPSLVLVSIQL